MLVSGNIADRLLQSIQVCLYYRFQSEEEAALNLPATIFMDRKHPEKLPAIQLSFIQHLVSPLFQACADAGIIPGILELSAESDKGNSSRTVSPIEKKEDGDVDGECNYSKKE